jgi:hypothetical protein
VGGVLEENVRRINEDNVNEFLSFMEVRDLRGSIIREIDLKRVQFFIKNE